MDVTCSLFTGSSFNQNHSFAPTLAACERGAKLRTTLGGDRIRSFECKSFQQLILLLFGESSCQIEYKIITKLIFLKLKSTRSCFGVLSFCLDNIFFVKMNEIGVIFFCFGCFKMTSIADSRITLQSSLMSVSFFVCMAVFFFVVVTG